MVPSRVRHAAVSVAAVLVLVCVVVVASWLVPGATGIALADGVWGEVSGGQKVVVFEDLTIGAGETWDNVVAVGGDVIVEGTVVNGIVVVGGDLTVRSGASIGHSPNDHPDDAAIVCVFGKVTVEPGAMVWGRTVTVAGGASADLHGVFVDPVSRPWTFDSVIVWIVSTIFIILVAVVITAIAPRQVAYVSRRARRHTLSSLGWGALLLFIGAPVATILLLVTVVGIVVAVPWFFIGIPIALLFGYVSVGALIGRALLGGRDAVSRGRVMGAAVTGVTILALLRWIPFAGSIVVLLALVIGFGALFTALWEWRRERRRHVPTPAATWPGGGPYVPPPGTGFGTPGESAPGNSGPAQGGSGSAPGGGAGSTG